ncbi:MAG TPA: hypothetical protein PKA98_15780, partial [Acidimicrobiales bacterium]|nr:hypothetical protein [Acidimicrobiales bacterium]
MSGRSGEALAWLTFPQTEEYPSVCDNVDLRTVSPAQWRHLVALRRWWDGLDVWLNGDYRGNPRTRSAMMLRWIWLVPPAMVP